MTSECLLEAIQTLDKHHPLPTNHEHGPGSKFPEATCVLPNVPKSNWYAFPNLNLKLEWHNYVSILTSSQEI